MGVELLVQYVLFAHSFVDVCILEDHFQLISPFVNLVVRSTLKYGNAVWEGNETQAILFFRICCSGRNDMYPWMFC